MLKRAECYTPKKVKKRFTEGEKLRAIIMLRDNNFNKDLTADMLGINVQTLERWIRDHGAKIETNYVRVSDLVKVEAGDSISTDLDIRHKAFLHELFTTKNVALSRLKEVVLRETNLSKITEALSLLHDMTSSMAPDDSQKKTLSDFLSQMKAEYAKEE